MEKKQHPIFKAIVIVSNQEDCDRARELCERYSIPVWKEDINLAFDYVEYTGEPTYLRYQSERQADGDQDRIGFYIDGLYDNDPSDNYNIMTLEQFQELANDYNPEFNSIDDILAVFKQAIK
jgi:hypothetical protein